MSHQSQAFTGDTPSKSVRADATAFSVRFHGVEWVDLCGNRGGVGRCVGAPLGPSKRRGRPGSRADLARGVRVLGPADSLTPSARTQARHAGLAVDTAEPAARHGERAGRRTLHRIRSGRSPAAARSGRAGDCPCRSDRRRGRRKDSAVSVAAPLWCSASCLVGPPGRRCRGEQPGPPPTARADRAAVIASPRIAALDEPAPSKPADPDEWEPVPVPLPTYLTKPKAPQLATRSIDLTHPGAWTSGRPEPTESIPLPRPMRDPGGRRGERRRPARAPPRGRRLTSRLIRSGPSPGVIVTRVSRGCGAVR